MQNVVDKMLHEREYSRHDSSNSTEMKEIGLLVEKVLGQDAYAPKDTNQEEDVDKMWVNSNGSELGYYVYIIIKKIKVIWL